MNIRMNTAAITPPTMATTITTMTTISPLSVGAVVPVDVGVGCSSTLTLNVASVMKKRQSPELARDFQINDSF